MGATGGSNGFFHYVRRFLYFTSTNPLSPSHLLKEEIIQICPPSKTEYTPTNIVIV